MSAIAGLGAMVGLSAIAGLRTVIGHGARAQVIAAALVRVGAGCHALGGVEAGCAQGKAVHIFFIVVS
ncbi:MAG: hypothetical protein WC590_11385 [Burkholderiaceae bacterium]